MKNRSQLSFLLSILLSFSLFLLLSEGSPVHNQTEAIGCGSALNIVSQNGRLYVNGNPFDLKGVNWFGFETEIFGPHGCWTFNSLQECYDFLLSFLKKNGFNAIRVPFAVDVIYYNYVSNNYPFVGQSALSLMDQLIDYAGKYGMLIMFDVQMLVHNTGISELWYEGVWTTERVKETLGILINRYSNRWNVFAIDIKNEPHGRASWGTNDVSTDWRLAAEDFASYIMQRNSNWLVFVEGLEKNAVGQSDRYYCYWGENLMGVRLNPIRVPNPERLVYSPHAYGPSVARMDYHSAPNFPENLDAIWEEHFGFVKDQTGRAVVLGEWGGTCEGDDQKYHERLSYWLKQKGISSTFYWCLNPNSGDTGGLLENDWRTPVTRKLELLQRHMPNPTVFC